MTDSMNIPEIETLSHKPNKLTTQTLEKSERGEDLHEVSNAEELIKELHSLEQPKSVKRGFMGLGCNKPASAPREGKEKTTLDIEPETGAENKESVGQPTEQPDCERCKTYGEIRKCPEHREQPNQQLMLIQMIQGLTTAILHDISKLPESELKAKALEEIAIFEKITLFLLQKEYE